MAKNKIRKQLRSGDIYRYIVTGRMPKVNGITDIHFSDGELKVEYNYFEERSYSCIGQHGIYDDDGLRRAIKQINKYITEVH